MTNVAVCVVRSGRRKAGRMHVCCSRLAVPIIIGAHDFASFKACTVRVWPKLAIVFLVTVVPKSRFCC